jgi:hypothetical protein
MLEIVKEYVQANEDYENYVEAVNKAFGGDNYIVDMVPASYSNNRDHLLQAVIGEDNFDWLMWFLYEHTVHNDGTPNVWIDEVGYVVNTLEDLVSICFTKK